MTDIKTQGETEARDKAWELVNEFVAGCGDLSAFQLAHAHQLVTSVGDALLSLSQERDRLREANEVRLERNRRQGERIAELCEALEPFAKDGDRLSYESMLVTVFGDATSVTTGDLRRARAALSGKTEEK